MELKDAIQGSIDKWENILEKIDDDDFDIEDVKDGCSLCTYYRWRKEYFLFYCRVDEDENCPLVKDDKSCFEYGIYGKIYRGDYCGNGKELVIQYANWLIEFLKKELKRCRDGRDEKAEKKVERA